MIRINTKKGERMKKRDNTCIFDYLRINQQRQEQRRSCFCVGPENCNDRECPLVKQYNERRLR